MILDIFIIKSKTVAGDKAKQYFLLIKEKDNIIIIVKRLTLTKNKELYKGSTILKEFREYILVEDIFGLKTKTLEKLLNHYKELGILRQRI